MIDLKPAPLRDQAVALRCGQMTPPRRVLVSIGVLVLTLLAILVVSWTLQTKKLSDALVADIDAWQARVIVRDPQLQSHRHDNGYACIAAALKVAPKDLGPFEPKNLAAINEVMDGGVVPADWETKLTELEPWAASLRACGDSARLSFVPGVSTFSIEPPGTRRVLALTLERMISLEARLRPVDGTWDTIAEHCAGTLEVGLDRSHLNLIGAMMASGGVRALAPPCGRALQHLSPDARAALAPRFARFPSRLAQNHEWLEAERLLLNLNVFGWMLSDAQKTKVPPAEFPLEASIKNPFLRFAYGRNWGRWDRAMRELVAVCDAPGPARLAASASVDTATSPWWLPSTSDSGPNYERFMKRTDDTRVLLQLLADLAAGEAKPLPQTTRTATGITFTDSNGEPLFIPF